ncbi:MAG: hypothetical protein MI861_15935, partial [Pirellulales bacterium]|nr:hypothetical protein [Pirellulales bacterium]
MNSPPTIGEPDPNFREYCETFAKSWEDDRQGTDLQSFLSQITQEDVDQERRPELFRELLRVEVEIRRRRGLPLELEQYLTAFPDFRSVIEDVFEHKQDQGLPTIEIVAKDQDATT